MQTMTIQQAAEATGWSQRMLRYLEQAGLVAALRTPGGHRHYGPRQIERLQSLRDLIDEHDLGITDIAFELRMRTDPLARPGRRRMVRSAAPARRPARRPASTAAWQPTNPTTRWKTPPTERREREQHPHPRHRRHPSTTSRSPTCRSGRVRPQGDRARRARDARPDGAAPRVRPVAAAQGQEGRRLAAHDRADRRAHRDPGRARRRRALGQLQHLLHPGPRRRRDRRRPERHAGQPAGRPGLRLEGRDAGGVLVVHRADAHLARRSAARTRSSTTAATPRC